MKITETDPIKPSSTFFIAQFWCILQHLLLDHLFIIRGSQWGDDFYG